MSYPLSCISRIYLPSTLMEPDTVEALTVVLPLPRVNLPLLVPLTTESPHARSILPLTEDTLALIPEHPSSFMSMLPETVAASTLATFLVIRLILPLVVTALTNSAAVATLMPPLMVSATTSSLLTPSTVTCPLMLLTLRVSNPQLLISMPPLTPPTTAFLALMPVNLMVPEAVLKVTAL